MGMYKYIREAWSKPKKIPFHRERLMQWNRQPSTVRIEHPTRLDRARSLGYKAKQGYVLVRQKVNRGGRMRPKFMKGRRSKHRRRKKIVNINYKQVAEQRAQKQYTNTEVLNSYFVGKNKDYYWYEIILIDRSHPRALQDHPFLKKDKGRVYKGKTSAGRKSRGILTNKGKGAEKLR
ncbi:50S ribosomal protein L15e [Candidatus Woesearchaeota archaeon]|nr:50S ribosomal protein L15e [Candidatus Woesearchaeota archaeon]